MGKLQQEIRQRQYQEMLSSAAIRAVSGQNDWQVRAQGLYHGHRRFPLNAPHVNPQQNVESVSGRRGLSDAMALRLRFSDLELHRSLLPEAPVQRLVFEWLEQLRVESLAPEYLPGLKQNLKQRFHQWSLEFHQAGLSLTETGILLYTLIQICWSRLNNQPVVEETEDFIEATRAGIVPLIGIDLAEIKKHRNDQSEYARAALSIAQTIDELLLSRATDSDDLPLQEAEEIDDENVLNLLLDFDEGTDFGLNAVVDGHSKVFQDSEQGYQVYDSQYDRQVVADSLVRTELLRELRESLDQRVIEQGINVARLARQLAALFTTDERDDWLFGQEEGYIDGRRLSQLVSSPYERRLFRQVRYQPKPNTAVTLLLDCSGSMKQHIEQIATLVDVFCRAAHLAGITTEILGFTTSAWNGGRVYKHWLSQGRPQLPGRLNEITHLIYKDATQSWRQSRAAIAALLKPDLFREGIDGEAVQWACQRMYGIDATRRVLMVISDGCPMDTATNLANDQYYLDNHLKQVVAQHEQQGVVEIYGLGVGLDLSPYYSRCLSLDLTQGLSNQVFSELLALLAGYHRH